MTRKEFIQDLEFTLLLLQTLRDSTRRREIYVVANETYVHVLNGNGLNNTDFNVITPKMGCLAKLFYSRHDAYINGMDYNLKDGAGNKVELNVIPATDYFSSVIEITKNMIKHLNIASE